MAPSNTDSILGKKRVKNGKSDNQPSCPPAQPPKCPECGSRRNWRDGHRYPENKPPIQRYLCRECAYRFSEKKQDQTKINIPRQDLKPLHSRTNHLRHFAGYNCNSQVCVTETEGTKNLTHQRIRQKRAAGATKLSKEDIAGKIVEYTWFLKKAGYSQGSDDDEGTIQKRTKLLRRLVNLGANLHDPEDVKKVIANAETWSIGAKINAVYAYQGFVEMEGLTWTPPKYKRPQTLPFVPYEEEIDELIHGCGKKVSIFLQGLKETGCDPGELKHAEWIDIDEKARTLNIKHPVKGHNPRILPISRALIDRFYLLPKARERIFPMQASVMQDNYLRQRKRIARKLNNPRLLKVTFTSVRHWKATMEYHKTRSILHVKELLGHKSLKNTMIYIDIERALYGGHRDDEFVSRVATSLKGARALIEAGFEYVTDMDDCKLFRKRK